LSDSIPILEQALLSALVLMLPKAGTDAPSTEVWCDASGFAVGAKLIQSGRPVEARTLTSAERNSSVGEQELLAVFHALTVWRHQIIVIELSHMVDTFGSWQLVHLRPP
jgi:hypothetical protein